MAGELAQYWTLCRNMSLGGMEMITDAVVSVGALFDFEIDLGRYGRVAGLGKVLRSYGGLLGVRFVVLSPASRFAIASYTSGATPGQLH